MTNYRLNAQGPEEQEIVNTRAKIAVMKVSKSVVKIFSLLALYNVYSLLLSASLSLASVSLSLGTEFYKQYSAEGNQIALQTPRFGQQPTNELAATINFEYPIIL